MTRSTPLLSSVLLGLTGLTAACIAVPYDGENIAPNPTTIIPELSGWGTAPSQSVKILAKNAAGGFDEVTSTTTSTFGGTWDGALWYAWKIEDYNLPAAYWTDKPGGCGQTATLRTRIGDYNGYSVDQPFYSCWSINQTTSEFLAACQSDNSPDVTIDTCGALCC